MKIVDSYNAAISTKTNSSDYRLGLVMLQKLGFITYTKNLERWLSTDNSIEPTWINVPNGGNDFWEYVPTITLKDSGRARSLVRAALKKQNFDALFYNTQIAALLSLGIMQRIPTIISLDATAENFSTVAETYREQPLHTKLFRKQKSEWFRKVFNTAVKLVAFSNWTKNSLINDYGIAPDKVAVIPPGIDLSNWQPKVKSASEDGKLRLLFVGGDFARKGGEVLLKAMKSGLSDRCRLDIVTKDEIPQAGSSVKVHTGLTANSPKLQQLYAEADLFIFPTLGDFTPIVIMEAMASGLPVIATDVGAISEEVDHGTTGFLVPRQDPSAIVEAVNTLLNDPQKRLSMGVAGREKAEKCFNGELNYKALIALLKKCKSISTKRS